MGEKSVGKTCLIKRYVNDEYVGDNLTTLGTDMTVHYKEINNKNMKITLVDTAGQERFGVITGNFYRGANCILFVYDCTNEQTFQKMENWFRKVHE